MSKKIKTKVLNYIKGDERNERALRIVSKLGRKVPLKDVLDYNDIDLFITINASIKTAEKCLNEKGVINKLLPKKIYKKIISYYSSCENTNKIFKEIKDSGSEVSIIFNHKEIKSKEQLNNLKIKTIKVKTKKIRGNDIESKLKTFAKCCKFNIKYEDICKYNDIEKIRFLNSLIKPRQNCLNGRNFNYSVKEFLYFINKFYYDEKFNYLYNEYLKTNNRFIKPSIDHIIPISKGGTDSVDNIQIISYLENTAKNNMTQEEWEEAKKNIQYYF